MMFSQLRKSKHFTQQRLADELQVKQSTIAMWETGKSKPAMKNLLRLSNILDVSIEEIYNSLVVNK